MPDILFQDAASLRLIGIAAAVLSALAYLPYIRDTLAGHTRPQRASWLIWSVLSSIALASQVHEGADASLWFAAFQVGGTVIIFALSIRRGVGSFMTWPDACVLWAAALGLLCWTLSDSAIYALAITITVSLLGGSVTVLKAYRTPGSETLVTWGVSWIAAALGMIAVGGMDWVLLAYPAYLFVLNGAIVIATLLGRARHVSVPVFVPRYTKNAAQ